MRYSHRLHLTDADTGSDAEAEGDSSSADAGASENSDTDTDTQTVPQMEQTYSTQKDARTAARMCNSRFGSVPSAPNTYRCTTDGCDCTRKVRWDKRQQHYSIITTGACTHTAIHLGKWIHLEPHVEQTLARLLLDKSYTPTSALAELQRVYRTDKTVQSLKIKWVEKHYHRRLKPETPKATVQGLKEHLAPMSRLPGIHPR